VAMLLSEPNLLSGPICAPDCNCKWCRLSDMSVHVRFKERVEALLAEYNRDVPPKPRLKAPPEEDGF